MIFQTPKFNFYTCIPDMAVEEIREDLIGDTFNFSFKGGRLETCIDLEITEKN